MSEAYPFESDDDIEIRELDLENVDAVAERRITVGQLAGENESWRYGHVIVDEAQDLTPMQWRMVMRRVRGRSLTIVGDLAQRSFAGDSASQARDWRDVLPPELADARRQDLTVNYRSPSEIHELATSVLTAFAPGVTASIAIRSSGHAPVFEQVGDVVACANERLHKLLDAVGGQIAVLGFDTAEVEAVASLGEVEADRVSFLTPNDSKGLEFDAVLLLEPLEIWASPGGPAQLYIALTRATQQLIVVHEKPLPSALLGE